MSELLLPNPRLKERRVPTRVGQTYFVRTFGCQMNEHDSERIAGQFEADGMIRADSVETADVVFINTCTIRENADNKLYGTLGSLAHLKDEAPHRALIVGGCAAQKDRELVRQRAPWVDVVLGTHNLDRVVDLLDQAQQWGPITEIVDELQAMPSALPVRRELAHSAWVTIQIGCNNTCTFCIVPSVRGVEISRRPGDIIREVTQLAADGVVEVTLLGQNVNTYGRDLAIDGKRRPIFADLLRRVGEVDGIERVRYTSPHPADFNEEVAVAMAETGAVCEQLHLPLQSGSDRVLARMHRGYNRERYLDRLRVARKHLPDLAVSTDIIVGFPGETEEDFDLTLAVIEEARFDSAYMFQFSARPGTAAADYEDDFVPQSVITERFDRLLDLQDSISMELNQAEIGKQRSVLVEGPSKRDPNAITGRTRGGKLVHVTGTFPPGSFLEVKIVGAGGHSLIGTLV
ncbi:MAG: tRNA (N6-isopentenyl adenosine(37)-C2)-methylthiotransferase MiaB [Acidimicrobiia bacterium]|nr:tRNA (N6-isopentenyl adenosine(37)-C2)-methylthiotransferase MiaB [Acidimicrobiia bacterium]MDH5420976.1 tRNA (N6-isopentenyl adenosine(37)-C2)-methylthiotransferase MiaB [Acidimicrobiia bacterium]MDH5504734.1 tRNA (N6-isopentenyl adenosine(37)-C2)-methylthiotransferase MiaB [Acidimicrobiia bacterium]